MTTRPLTEGSRKGRRHPPPQNFPIFKTRRKSKSKALAISRPAQPKSLLEVIAEAARDPSVDTDKMRALLQMKREEEDRQAEIFFNNALADAKEEMPAVAKDSRGDRNIWYASLEKVSKTLDPIMKRHGLQLSFGMADSPNIDVYRITGELRHRAGYKRSYFADIPVSITGPKGAPIMTKAQGAGSAISYGRRNIKLMIFDITIVGQDTDGGPPAPEVLDSDELIELGELMKKAKASTPDFCDYFKIGSVPELPKARLAEATKILNRKIKDMESK